MVICPTPYPLPEDINHNRGQELLLREGGVLAKKWERSAKYASAPIFSDNKWRMCSMD